MSELSTILDAALAYPSAYPRKIENANEAPVCAILPLALNEPETYGWAPGSTLDEAADAIQNLVTSLPLQTSGLGYHSDVISSLLQAQRDEYHNILNAVREDWLRNNRVVTDGMHERLVKAKFDLRLAFRKRTIVPGVGYRVIDFVNGKERTSLEHQLAKYGPRIKEMLDKGQIEEAIRSALKSDAKTDIRVLRLKRFGKVAGKMGPIVLAIQIPYYAYSASTAKNKEELHNALTDMGGAVGGAIVTGALSAAFCVGLGLTTGGLGFLFCGLAPVIAGFYADDAASFIINKLDPINTPP